MTWARSFLMAFPLLVTGCAYDWNYALTTVRGEFEYLSRAVPIEQALGDSALTDDQRAKLGVLIAAREHAGSVIGLNVGNSYRSFVNLNGKPLAWNLSASPKTSIEPHYWSLPLVGQLPYLGFFETEPAVVERDRLVGLGFDTFTYEVDAFSTLGLLPDPVASSMLRRSIPSLADTVFHELLHATIWRQGDTDFSESLATFVGRAAAREFLTIYYGPDSAEVAQAVRESEDLDKVNAFLNSLRDEVELFYASEPSPLKVITDREAIFSAARSRFDLEVMPTMHEPERYRTYANLAYNNAFLLVNVRYNSSQDLFAEVHQATGGSWPDTLLAFNQAAASPDPVAFLKALVAAPPAPATSPS